MNPASPRYREHAERPASRDNGCWWHSTLPAEAGDFPEGRFDLPSPEGTCYLAATEGAAARERCGRFLAHHRPIPLTHVEGRVVTRVLLPRLDGPVADLLSAGAAASGVTGEIHTTPDYRLTAEWAAAIRQDGFGALRYMPRFTPGREWALAVFGPKGAHPDRPIVGSRPLADILGDLGYDIGRSTIPSTTALRLRTEDYLDAEDAAEADPSSS